MKNSILLFLLLPLLANAEQPWPQKLFGLDVTETKTSDLPKSLRSTLLKYDEFQQGTGTIPDTFFVGHVNLSSKGVTYVVQSHQGYSGGPAMILFEEHGAEFVELAYLQGSVYFAKRVNGYNQIVDQGRGGGGSYTRMLLRFNHGKYQCVRLTDYKIVGDDLKFVQERNPAEFATP